MKENEEENIDDFFKPKNLNSRQEKYEKEFEAECQEIFNMSIDKLKSIYFSFYDQMNEPEKSQAKNNFNIEAPMSNDIPKSISDAIGCGFYWFETPEGNKYWNIIFVKYKFQ